MKFCRSRRAKGKVEKRNTRFVLISCRLQSESSLITALWSSAANKRRCVFSIWLCSTPAHCKVRHDHLFIECVTFVWTILRTQRRTAMQKDEYLCKNSKNTPRESTNMANIGWAFACTISSLEHSTNLIIALDSWCTTVISVTGFELAI